MGKMAHFVGIHGMKWTTFLYINLFPLLIELPLTLTFLASYSLLCLLSYTRLLCRRSLFHCKRMKNLALYLLGFHDLIIYLRSFSQGESLGKGAVAEKSYHTSEVRGGGLEELPHPRGQGPRLRGATPPSRSRGMAVRRYPLSKVRSSGCALLEQP